MLNARDIVTYLLAHGLMRTQTVIDGDLVITDASRRHCNFRVSSSAAETSYFVKQDADPEAGALGTVGYEAAVYALLTSVFGETARGVLVPRRHAYAPALKLLVLDLVPGAESLRDYHARRNRFPRALAARVGRVLGSLHRALPPAALAQAAVGALSCRPPVIFSIVRPPVRLLTNVSQANLALIKEIQQVPRLCAQLDQVAQGWLPEALIHGDVRWDNCLVVRSDSGKGLPAVRLIDWEYAALGDPAWDLGVFFSQYLSYWVLSIPPTAEGSTIARAQQATSPIAGMQPAIRACWRAYAHQARLRGAAREELLVRAVRYAGVRLLETAFERLDSATQLSRDAVYLVQLGMNVLDDPRRAATQLLGLAMTGIGVP